MDRYAGANKRDNSIHDENVSSGFWDSDLEVNKACPAGQCQKPRIGDGNHANFFDIC
jgi:hypothetical protein